MMRVPEFIIVLSVLSTASCARTPEADAQAAPPSVEQMGITRAGEHAATKGAPANFTGSVVVTPVFAATKDARASCGSVTFAPGARSAWHSHPAGQRLVVTAGTGWVQEWGEAKQEIKPGDVVSTPPGVKHWHGATRTESMTHLAIQEHVDGKVVNWMELVSDEQYGAVPSAAMPPATVPSAAMPRAHETTTTETLSAKQQTIPLIASFVATSDLPKLNAALNQGLDTGLTISESKELLVQLYAYAGFPRSLNALSELMKVVEARKQRGIQDAPGREPSRSIPTGAELVAVGTANQTKISGAPVQGPLFDFAPVINQFLQAHLFGDIFERDNLDWQSRELATVGALASTPGAEPQLRSHMAASLRVGLTAGQLRQLTQVLAEHGASDAAERATEALTQVIAR